MHRRPFIPAALTALVFLLSAGAPAWGAAEREAAEKAAERPTTLLTMIEDGGWSSTVFMSILGLLSLATVAVILDRLVNLSRRKVIPPQFVSELQELAKNGGEDPAPFQELCRRFPTPAASVLKAGLLRAGRPVLEVEKALEDALAREAAALRSRVRPLTVAANVAPLIGLLGTVIGIIMAFHHASRVGLGGRGEVMAQGISLALLATAGGLAIAIPALLCAAYFNMRIDRLLREADECLMEVIPCFARMEGTTVS
jgi:biopolymer transport protein ExbB